MERRADEALNVDAQFHYQRILSPHRANETPE
jgi:hypothetical protein